MIDRSTIDRIFAAADIVDIVGDFVTLKRKGTNYQACCPFHNEKTPSFVVSPAKGLYKCFGCGKGGNAVNFVMEHESLTYPEALKWVAKKYGIEVKEKEENPEERQRNDNRESMMVASSFANQYFIDQLKTDKGESIAVGYFRERGFTDVTIDKFQLGYCPDTGDAMTRAALDAGYKEEFLVATGLTILPERGGYYDRFAGRVMFPVHSLAGRVVAFGGRTLRSDKKVAKYLNSPESEIYHKGSTLYGIYFAKGAITRMGYCILVEGYTDVLQMHQAGVENVVASSGTSLTVDQIKLIKRFTRNVTVIYDGDAAGIKASMRGIDMLLKEGLTVRVVALPEGDDPDSFARSHNATELQQYIEDNEQDFISFKTDLLLGDAAGDPIKRAELISDVVGSIAVIADDISRSVFVQQCAQQMGISEDLIMREVARRRVTMVDGRAGSEVMQNVARKDRFERSRGASGAFGAADDQPPVDLFVPEDDSITGNASEGAAPFLRPYIDPMRAGLARELEQLERELLGYLIKYGAEKFDFAVAPTEIVQLDVASTIIDDLQADQIAMSDPLCNRVYQEYLTAYNEMGAPPPSYFVNSPSAEVSSMAVDLLTAEDVYTYSSMWARSEIPTTTERERLSEAIPKAITLYKSKVVSSIISGLQQDLTKVTDMEQAGEMLQRLNQLNELRRDIYEKYLRTV